MQLNEIEQKMHAFIQEKSWYAPDSPKKQTPRNLAISLSIEAAEILEHFQWREDKINKSTLSGELADVALYLIQLASVCEIDLENAIVEKLSENIDREWPDP